MFQTSKPQVLKRKWTVSEKKLKGQWIQPSEGNSPQLTKGGKLRKNSKSSRELARPQLVSSPIVPQGSRTCLTHGGNSVHTVEWTSEWLGEGGNRSHRGLQPERREGKTHSPANSLPHPLPFPASRLLCAVFPLPGIQHRGETEGCGARLPGLKSETHHLLSGSCKVT